VAVTGGSFKFRRGRAEEGCSHCYVCQLSKLVHTAVIVLKQACNGKASALTQTHTLCIASMLLRGKETKRGKKTDTEYFFPLNI